MASIIGSNKTFSSIVARKFSGGERAHYQSIDPQGSPIQEGQK
jgi:hypothetical protein